MKWSLYFHTVRCLKPVQIYARVRYALRAPKLDPRPAPSIRSRTGVWRPGPPRERSLIQANRFRFLNVEHEIPSPSAWNHAPWGSLWLFNLHYFDDLVARGASRRTGWHSDLIHRWIAENPPPQGMGWKPYTISLRIVNWIKWCLSGYTLSDEALQSLALQTRVLQQRIERHIQGNHLIANAKALVFAGLFFEGSEAEQWLDTGLALLASQLHEQILPDGGHYERSPMYHSILLEDMLDLVNLSHVYSEPPQDIRSRISQWQKTIQAMRYWLTIMNHPDGYIALFNDAALGIASSLHDLDQYAMRLGIAPRCTQPSSLTLLPDTGYIRVHQGRLCAILDVGEVGPAYIPAHAHADTLSFEVSWRTQRVVVDSGTSCYDNSEERQHQRATTAHNTVTIDGYNSSEVWDVFRVARRAVPFDLHIEDTKDSIRVRCAHDGYRRLPGKPTHRRIFEFSDHRLVVNDTVQGRGIHEVSAYLHFYPGIFVELHADKQVIMLLNQHRIGMIRIEHWHTVRFFDSWYYPEFGKRKRNVTLRVDRMGHLPFEGKFEIVFHAGNE